MWLTNFAKFLQYVGASGLFGIAFFLIAFVRPHGQPFDQILRLVKRLFAVACVLVLVGAFISLIGYAASMNDLPLNKLTFSQVAEIASTMDVGRFTSSRIVISVVALFLIFSMRRATYFLKLQCSIGAIILASLAFTGHGAKDEGVNGIIHLGADIAHLLGAGLWIGSLFAFLTLLLMEKTKEVQLLMYDTLSRFSGLGSIIVATIILSGLVNSYFLIGIANITRVFTSPYGILLSVKIGLFSIMVILAALNRFVLTPNLGKSFDDGVINSNIMKPINKSIILETSIGLIVIFLVSIFSSLEPLL
ncbi:MAG: copper homeostasis membrane protein CopD [Proteobacteria bacterium]|nr:copper homeostasis membrane protein CopD [Pseudomonadota bacterium]